jgi:hypothetical protein
LVVVQVAFSLVLVAGALLFTRSLNKLLTVDTGLRPEGILIAQAGYGWLNLPTDRRELSTRVTRSNQGDTRS